MTFINNSLEWDEYIDNLDKSGSWGAKPYRHGHYGSPKEYPCVVESESWDDPNGPYSYDHEFTYKKDVIELYNLFKEYDNK